MNPKNKSEEMLTKYGSLAPIVIDEIIEVLDAFGYTNTMYDDFETGRMYTTEEKDPTEYYKKVKKFLQ